jgi:hypothetical protein
MQGNEELRTARESALRFFGLSHASHAAQWKLVAALIVIGALVMAASPRHSFPAYIGGAVWLLGAALAILGCVRLVRVRRFKSN